MNAKEFFIKTAKMRQAQELYKSTRLNIYYAEARSLEEDIDTEIKRVQEVTEKTNNPKLF